MRSIVFDSGPVISLTTNNLLWILRPLKEFFKGHFHITNEVKYELIDKPLKTKRFKFEALQVYKFLNEGILEVADDKEIQAKTDALINLANNTYNVYDQYINIVHRAEMSSIASSIHFKSQAVVVDERSTRLLIENPKKLLNILRHNLLTKVKINKKNLNDFKKLSKDVKLIRSVELVTIAYERGMLNGFIADIPDSRKTLLESILWGVKLNGCTVSKKEIEQILRMEAKEKKI